MTAAPAVSVALLSWNGRQHLETCLAALDEQDDPGVAWELLVLDNGSSDGTADWVRAHHPRARLIESPVNLGFCAGNNRLVEAARGEAVAFLNNDTRPARGWLKGLVEALAAAPADVAAVSGEIVDWTGERLDFARGVMTFDGHAFQVDFRRPLAVARPPAAGEELLFACGGNMLVRRASFLAAGGFDEDYFAYLEDVDLGWRLWAGGERVTFAPAAVVHHRSSATSDLLGLFNRGFLFERNAFLTAYKNYEPGLWEQVMPAILLTFLARTQALLVGNNPGAATLALDPYAGHIANTAVGPQSDGGGSCHGAVSRATARAGALGTVPPADPMTVASLARKWRDY
ncbi:MAG TPA: glycosyltransferase family 2 protein, partial [Thermoanaerobaculia bacterium]|nr:glycosyltransferase family 2 protein [Thermoanaerobaculia bacterium]